MNTQCLAPVAVLLAMVFGAGGCSSSNPPSSDLGSDAETPGDASGSREDAAQPTEAGDASHGDQARSCDGGPLGTPDVHRVAEVACPVSTQSAYSFPDGGPVCTTDSECADASNAGIPMKCLQGRCALDQCLVDSDCATGSTCACAGSYYGGNGEHPNRCFPSNCRLDSDCGSGGYCSPSTGGFCGTPTGFYCHGPADTCTSNADCVCESPQAGGACQYEPTVGHWQCEPLAVCNG